MAQLILGVVSGHQLMELLNNFYIVYGGQNLLYAQKSRTEMPMSLMVSIVVNCYYFGAYFAERHFGKGLKTPDAAAAPALEAAESSENMDGIASDQMPGERTDTGSIVNLDGVEEVIQVSEKEKLPLITYADGERILVQHLDIAAVGLEGGNLAIYTFSGKRYYDTRPLKTFFSLLDSNDYYHTSRQTIVHRDAVRSIAPSKSKRGGLDVSLTIDADINVEVASRSVARFKEWLAAGSSPSARKRSIPVPMLF